MKNEGEDIKKFIFLVFTLLWTIIVFLNHLLFFFVQFEVHKHVNELIKKKKKKEKNGFWN
jgi:cytochrome b subunit of formate dehydrogenase